MADKRLTTAITQLKAQFLAGARFLHQQRTDKNGSERTLAEAQWFVVIGSHQAGKTQLLANAELPFVFSRQKLPAKQNFDTHWWASKEAVFIDVPANYLVSKHLPLWKIFVRLVKRYAFQKKLDGIFVVLSLDELTQTQHHKVILKTLSKRLQLLRNQFKQRIPLYFIFNKMDTLPQFNTFFAALDKSSRQQPWGVYFNPERPTRKQADKGLTGLVQRLRARLLTQLGQSEASQKNEAYYAFVENFTALSPAIHGFFTLIDRELQKKYLVQGVFFTAAINEAKTKALTSYQAPQFHTKSQAYFIHELLTEAAKTPSVLREKHNKRLIAYTITGCLCVLFAVLLTLAHEVGKREQSLMRVNEQLAALTTANEQNDQQHTLAVLDTASRELKQGILPTSINNLGTSLNKQYQTLLSHTSLPILTGFLSHAMNNPSLAYSLRYEILATYLALTKAEKIEPQTLRTLAQAIESQDPSAQLKLDDIQLKSLLHALAEHVITFKPNNAAIQHCRQSLAHLPKASLVLLLLATDPALAQKLSLDFDASPLTQGLFTYKTQPTGIAKLYTAASFAKLTPDNVKKEIQTALQGNDVLGQLHRSNTDPKMIYQQFITLYTHNYNLIWQGFIDNITVSLPTGLAAMPIAARAPQALTALLHLIQQNLPDGLVLQPELATLKTFSDHPTQANLLDTLQQLATPLSTITTNKAAFNYAKNRFYNLDTEDNLENAFTIAQSLPAPIKSWVSALVSDTWGGIITASNRYLEQVWQKRVYAFYQAQFANHYPFDTQADKETSLAAFNRFFARDGIYTQFLHKNLTPFLHTGKRPWTLKKRDGLSIALSQPAMDAMMQAQTIRDLYFQQESDEAFFRFSVQPTAADAQLSMIAFSLGKQHILFTAQNMQRPQYLIWPDKHDQTAASLAMITVENRRYRAQQTGPWALFRLAAGGKLSLDTSNAHQWLLTYPAQDAHTPELQLAIRSKTDKNPLALENFSSFVLPTSLLSTGASD